MSASWPPRADPAPYSAIADIVAANQDDLPERIIVQKPSIGRIVFAIVDPTRNNGSEIAPAVITRVWEETDEGAWIVNYKILYDGEAAPGYATSARLYNDERAARAASGPLAGVSSYWPPKV